MKYFRITLCVVLAFALFVPHSQAQRRKKKQSEPAGTTYDSGLYSALEWRNIGPFRGGRATAVSGVTSDPLTYYMGSTGGGVWKTTDAGESWSNISDGFFSTGSVGAIAVAESDPNVVYVGMGEAPVRGVMTSHGDGVYKSDDGGKTWKNMGLKMTRHISKIAVHPKNPDVVFVAAQGSPYGATEDRGIYRSMDGGESWTKVHYVDENSGVSDLSMDMTNPRIIYAAYWDHRRFPWQVRSGGPGSGIWRSTDGGDSWEELKRGLPGGVMGKIGVSVSKANPERVWAIIEAENGGLYRSDNGGDSWRLINPDRLLRARSWYYMHIQAHPTNPDHVFIMNAPLLESTDGGRTFRNMNTRHGDNHQIWVNPENPDYMINANDGGANISINGGQDWSRQDNQPTAQFYRVNADNQFPYRVYGGQQDNSSVSILSRTTSGGITNNDFYSVGGCESAYSAFDPDNPEYVYSGCYQGIIGEWNRATRATKDVMAYPIQGLGTNPRDVKYRFNWNAPIIASHHDPSVIYHAGNVVMRTKNRGVDWEVISPDLTKNDTTHLNWGGAPITNEGAGGEVYHTIYYLAESPHDANVLYAGADDGLLHITRDGGQNWTNITPPNLEEGMVNQIEVSSHDPGTVYLAYNRYKFNDFTPHIFKSTDYGQNWERIVNGIEEEAHVRVVREDPAQKGLLYAGTELGIYISFDGGVKWTKFQQNLPVVPITDLKVHQNDLIAATQGRAFWIMDDLTPLHQIAEAAQSDFFFFEPRSVVRMNGGRSTNPAIGRNPYPGTSLFYYLKEDVDSVEIKVEIKDAEGTVVRTFASDATERQERLSKSSGLNRLNWNLNMTNFDGVDGIFVGLGAGGHRVAPGNYTVTMTYGEMESTHTLEVTPDPRWKATPGQYREQETLLRQLRKSIIDLQSQITDLRSMRDQLEDLAERIPEDDFPEVHEAAGDLISEIDRIESEIVQPQQETFQDVINFPNKLEVNLLHIYGTIDGLEPPVTGGQKQRVEDMQSAYTKILSDIVQLKEEKLAAFNAMIREKSVPFISPKKEN